MCKLCYGKTKLNEGRYCETCFLQMKNTSRNMELVIEGELNNNADSSIWPSPTQSPVHKSQIEVQEKENNNINQETLEIVNDDLENKLDNSENITNLETFIDNKSEELKDLRLSFYKKDLNMHVLYERLYQEQKMHINTIEELYNKTIQSLKEDILFLRNEVQKRNEFIDSIINSSKKDKENIDDSNVSKTYSRNHEKDVKNAKQSTTYTKRKINKVSPTKIDNNRKLNVETKHNKVHGNSHEMVPKKYYELIGDSHLNNIYENGLRTKERKVNIKHWWKIS